MAEETRIATDADIAYLREYLAERDQSTTIEPHEDVLFATKCDVIVPPMLLNRLTRAEDALRLIKRSPTDLAVTYASEGLGD
jgi:hypothetical protein